MPFKITELFLRALFAGTVSTAFALPHYTGYGGESATADVESANETNEEYQRRRAKYDLKQPYLFKAWSRDSENVGYILGTPDYCTPALSPVHPDLQSVFNDADVIIAKFANVPQEPFKVAGEGDTVFDTAGDPRVPKLILEGIAGVSESTRPPIRLRDHALDKIKPWKEKKQRLLAGPIGTSFPVFKTLIENADDYPPLAFVALLEGSFEFWGQPRSPTVNPLSLAIIQAAIHAEKTLLPRQTILLKTDLPLLSRLFRERSGAITDESALADFMRCVDMLLEFGSDEYIERVRGIMRREYDAWFDNDTYFMGMDEGWDGWMKTRLVSEWRRRLFSEIYAAQLRDTMKDNKCTLMLVPMEYLANVPGNIQDHLSGYGMEYCEMREENSVVMGEVEGVK